MALSAPVTVTNRGRLTGLPLTDDTIDSFFRQDFDRNGSRLAGWAGSDTHLRRIVMRSRLPARSI